VALIASNVLLRIADRMAYQFKLLKDAADAAKQQWSGYYADVVTGTDDADVEIPLLSPSVNLDSDFDAGSIAKNGTLMSGVVWGMIAHFARKDQNGASLQSGGWDGYLQAHDVRVSYYFAQVHKAITSRYMMAPNVFSESADLFGTVEVDAGLVLMFRDGVNYGDGDLNNPADGSHYAGTQLQIRVDSFGAADLSITLRVKKLNNTTHSVGMVIAGGTPDGSLIDVGAANDRFLDLIGVEYTGVADGTVGDVLTVWNKKERQIVL